MTFDDFKQLCDQAFNTQQEVTAPCPIVIGDGDDRAYLGDTPDHHLIVFKTVTDAPTLHAIYDKVRFKFNAPNNHTVIQPLTTGT